MKTANRWWYNGLFSWPTGVRYMRCEVCGDAQRALGGPFVSLAYPDSAQGRLLVTEGFIYSPDTNKRDLVRRMEAALRTLAPVKP